jgi:uncharacterized protein YhbP (UPF0306 family)
MTDPQHLDRAMDNDGTQAALALIRGGSTLTLATAAGNGPWSAPVYYVFLDGCFYFFSSPDSRHIREAAASGSAAASVFEAGDSWQTLKGLQMAGKIESVESAVRCLKVVTAYLQRYDFVRAFFTGRSSLTADDFFSRFRARLYAFLPEAVYFVDNRMGMGNRRQVNLKRPH